MRSDCQKKMCIDLFIIKCIEDNVFISSKAELILFVINKVFHQQVFRNQTIGDIWTP